MFNAEETVNGTHYLYYLEQNKYWYKRNQGEINNIIGHLSLILNDKMYTELPQRSQSKKKKNTDQTYWNNAHIKIDTCLLKQIKNKINFGTYETLKPKS